MILHNPRGKGIYIARLGMNVILFGVVASQVSRQDLIAYIKNIALIYAQWRNLVKFLGGGEVGANFPKSSENGSEN